MKINSNSLTQSYERKKPVQELYSQQKTYEELNLMDSFLFESATEKPENAVVIARAIIERSTGRKVKKLVVHPQKDLKGININKHGIRMDVYLEEIAEGTESEAVTCVYDIEPNNYNDKDIPRRNRYYQSLIDSKLLPAGVPYAELPDMLSIWILPYDPFGDDRMVYTVKNMVEENNQIIYNDGVTKVFLYTKGMVGGSEKLENLLRFMENSIRDNAVDDELVQIMKIVEAIKSNPEERKRYMGLMGVIEYEKRDAYEEGLEVGHESGYQSGLEEGVIQGMILGSRSNGADRDKTKKDISSQFGLTEDKAEEYMKRYWNENVEKSES